MGEALELRGIDCRLGGQTILNRIDLALAPGEVVALLGPSGCGKTTLLRLVAGTLNPDGGEILIGGRRVACAGQALPPEARQLGMVFQDYALWPHLSVADNVGFPLAVRGIRRADRARRIETALARVGLADFGSRYPGALSGGQQQRVALARAIVVEPALLLFDEPLSNLDRELRESLCIEIGELLREIGSTALYVTHDHEEALTLADRVAVMARGRILQLDRGQVLIDAPASVAVARFLKLGNLLDAEIGTDGGLQLNGVHLAPCAKAPWHGRRGSGQLLLPLTALVESRPDTGETDANSIAADVRMCHYRGGAYEITLQPAGATTRWRWLSTRPHPIGARLHCRPDYDRLRWFDAPASVR